MKTSKASWLFACGALLGLSIALCLAAGEKTNATPKASPMVAPTDAPRSQWARLKLVAYPSGATGFFDPDTGILYLYDSNLRNCYLIRQLQRLGDPMQRP